MTEWEILDILIDLLYIELETNLAHTFLECVIRPHFIEDSVVVSHIKYSMLLAFASLCSWAALEHDTQICICFGIAS